MENQNQNNCNDRPTIQNNFYGNIGQQINHVDKIEAHFDKDMGIQVDGQNIVPPFASGELPDEEWIDEIVSCFMGIRENALQFVNMARNMKPKEITKLVNAWLVMKKISSLSCKRDLWKPLYEHGIYECTEQNWNNQVQIPQ